MMADYNQDVEGKMKLAMNMSDQDKARAASFCRSNAVQAERTARGKAARTMGTYKEPAEVEAWKTAAKRLDEQVKGAANG